MHSVLAKAKREDGPFPHVVIENCLPDDLYADLLASRPCYASILSGRDAGDNQRVDRCGVDLLADETLPEVWKDFVGFHTSPAFWKEICAVFGLGREEESTGLRFRDRADIVLDCQLGVNTPTETRSKVRGPHVDNPIEVFGGLLYMGEGEGGDLLLYEPVEPLLFHGKAEVHDYRVRAVKRAPYKHNTFVGFVNTLTSLHGVTPRGPTFEPRWLVNIIAEQSTPQFELPRERDERRTDSLLHRL